MALHLSLGCKDKTMLQNAGGDKLDVFWRHKVTATEQGKGL